MKKRYGKTAAGLLALLIMALCLTLTGCSEILDVTESILTEVAESAEEEAGSKQVEEASAEKAESKQEEDAPVEDALAEENVGEPEEAEPQDNSGAADSKAENSDVANSDVTKSKSANNDAIKKDLRFRNKKLLNDHYEKHGREMGFSSAEEYEKAAAMVPANENALHKIEAEDGDDVYYIEESNEFVVVSTDGYIRTYFEPNSGKKYFDRQ